MRLGVLATALAVLLLAGFPFAATAGPSPDMDSDGTADVFDVCKTDGSVPAPCAFDTDKDGYGNTCDGDFTNDGVVDFVDVPTLITDITSTTDGGSGTDMNCDGVVDFVDVGVWLAQLSQTFPGPSGLPCAGTIPCHP